MLNHKHKFKVGELDEPVIEVGSKWVSKDSDDFVATITYINYEIGILTYDNNKFDSGPTNYPISKWFKHMSLYEESCIITETVQYKKLNPGSYLDGKLVINEDHDIALNLIKNGDAKHIRDLIKTLNDIADLWEEQDAN